MLQSMKIQLHHCKSRSCTRAVGFVQKAYAMHLICVFTTIHYCLTTIHNVLKIISLGGLEKQKMEILSRFIQGEWIHFVLLYSLRGTADVQVPG